MSREAIPVALRFAILKRDKFRCRYCGARAGDRELVLDHVLPVASGGKDKKWNLVSACVPCNSAKSDKILPIDLVNGLLGELLADDPDAAYFCLLTSHMGLMTRPELDALLAEGRSESAAIQ